MPTLEGLSARIIAYIVGGLVAVCLLWAAVHFYNKSRSEGAQGRVNAAQSDAAANSSADAVNTISRSDEAATASEAQTRANEKEIRDAKGSDAAVDPAVRDAGLRSLCKRNAYRDSERCRVFKPNP